MLSSRQNERLNMVSWYRVAISQYFFPFRRFSFCVVTLSFFICRKKLFFVVNSQFTLLSDMIVILVVIISEDRNYVRKKSVNLTWITHSIRTHTATVESQLNMLVRCIQRFRLISFAQKHTAHTAIAELNSVVSWYYVYIRGIRRRNITTKTTKWREWTNEEKNNARQTTSACVQTKTISAVCALRHVNVCVKRS